MKIPESFRPEKGLDGKIEELKEEKEYKEITSLENLFSASEEFIPYDHLIGDPNSFFFNTLYPGIKIDDVEGFLMIAYEEDSIHGVDFIHFKDTDLLKNNIPKLLGIKSQFSKKKICKTDIYVRSNYTMITIDCPNEIIGIYQEKFGFKIIKNETS